MWVRRSIETEKNIKTKLFLAAASMVDIEMLVLGYQNEIKNIGLGPELQNP